DDDLFITRHGRAVHEVGAAAEGSRLAAVRRIVVTDRLVASATNHVFGYAEEADRSHLLRVSGDRARLLAGFDVPNFDRVVGAGTSDQAVVRLDRHAQDVMRVPLERLDQFAGSEIPQLHELIRPAAAEGFPVAVKFET